MKKNVLFIALALFLSLPVWAQEETTRKETTITEEVQEAPATSSVVLNGSPYNFIFQWKKKATESHWTGLGYAFIDLAGLPGIDLNLSRSHSVLLNLADYFVPFNRNWLAVTGLGFDWSRYHFRGNNRLQTVDGKTAFVPDPENREYHASRLLVYYATIPLLLEYQTKINRNHSFFVYGGVEGLVKLYSKSQIDVKTPNGIKKEDYRDLNLLPVNFRFTARIGIENFSIFGYYQPVSMFESGKGPDIRSQGIGLMLNF
jgi:hypothetical protein